MLFLNVIFVLNKFFFQQASQINQITYYVLYKYNTKNNFFILKNEVLFTNLNMNYKIYQYQPSFNTTPLNNPSKTDYLSFIIDLKRKNGFFRKNSKIKKSIINYFSSSLLSDSLDNNNLNPKTNFHHFFNFLKYDSSQNIDYKNIDLKLNLKKLIKNNREILNFFYLNRNIRQKKFNKFFKNLIKLDTRNYLEKNTFFLRNVLIDLNFFKNRIDFFFFLNNGFINLNTKIIKKYNYVLNTNDVIFLNYNSYFYLYYRNFCENKLYKSNFNNLVWKVNKEENDNVLNTSLKFIDNMYVNTDIPVFFEVDYITNSLVLLFKPNFFFFFNQNRLLFLNFFINRLNNWKFIN